MNLPPPASCSNGGGADAGAGVGRVLRKVTSPCGVWNTAWLCAEASDDMGAAVSAWPVPGGGGGEGVACCAMAWPATSKAPAPSRVIQGVRNFMIVTPCQNRGERGAPRKPRDSGPAVHRGKLAKRVSMPAQPVASRLAAPAGDRPLSLAQARCLQLHAQGLLQPPRRRARAADLSAAVARMRLLQIDT